MFSSNLLAQENQVSTEKTGNSLSKLVSSFWFYPAILALLVLILNGPALGHTFLADDWYLLYDQAQKGFGGKLFGFGSSLVRPVGVITWQLLYAWFGFNSVPYNLVALMLQLANTWLIYSIVTRLAGSKIYGFCAGVIFCTYYLGWEPTLWLASSFFDVQCAFFMLLTFRLFLQLENAHKIKIWLGLWLSLIITFGLAVFNKETGLLLWPVLLLYNLLYWRITKRRLWQSALLYGTTLLVILFYGLSHIIFASSSGVDETTEMVHLDKVVPHIFYHLEGLYLFPSYPFGLNSTELLRHELKFSLWLAPTVLIFLFLLFSFWFNKNKNGSRWATINLAVLKSKTVLAVRLFVFGLGWTATTSLATLPLSYSGLRFFYIPHIGVVFSFTAVVVVLTGIVTSLKLSPKIRLLGYGGVIYAVAIVSLFGVMQFLQGNALYGKSSDFVEQLTSLTQEQFEKGATSVTLVNMPQVIEQTPGSGDYAFCFFDETDLKEALSLRLGISASHFQVLRTGDFAQFGYFTTSSSTVAASAIPASSPTHVIITVEHPSISEFIPVVTTAIK